MGKMGIYEALSRDPFNIDFLVLLGLALEALKKHKSLCRQVSNQARSSKTAAAAIAEVMFCTSYSP